MYAQPHISVTDLSLSYYLPDTPYKDEIPTPKEILGYQVGEWHVSHDQLLYYMRKLAEVSDRIQLTTIGYTFEDRPLIHLIISSPENLSRIDEIQSQHVALTDPEQSAALDVETMPGVVYMGYTIHGNEPSGTNAALLLAYYLAACEDEALLDLLSDMIILLDPCLNPDGLHRFSTWVNMHKGIDMLITDPNNRELNEPWPSGRTNHFWFDPNRDWLPIQLPESQARIRQFHAWKPNYLTDHHEMGSNSTFFFQPGIPSRNYPLTPENVYTLTDKMAQFHSRALDSIGSLYFTEESFDDYYVGKGSTYPDVNGAVGILFEQGSSRGHARETDNGILSFPFTIRNQLTTSFSTLHGTHALKNELLTHQRVFFQSALEEAAAFESGGYVVSCPEDPARLRAFTELVMTHDIDIYQLNEQLKIDTSTFTPGNSFVIPLQQPQHRLIRAIFEKNIDFVDSLFYDVSAWTLPLSFHLQYAPISQGAFGSQILGALLDTLAFPEGRIIGGKSDYAYLFEWKGYYAPRALYRLQKQGILTRVATQTFGFDDPKSFGYGTILVPVAGQPLDEEALYQELTTIAQENAVDIYSMKTGLSATGMDLGSNNFEKLEIPEILMVVGRGISSYEAGEIWHLLDQRFHMPITMVEQADLGSVNLSDYNTMILVSGRFTMRDNMLSDVKSWVRAGGNIIAIRGAVQWIAAQKMGNVSLKNQTRQSFDSTTLYPYINRRNVLGAQAIGGAIFQVNMDLTHPIAYGYTQPKLSVFRNTQIFLEKGSNPYQTPVIYETDPLLSGYISNRNLETLAETPSVHISSMGRGHIICMTDNPNFRAFWWGTNKLFMNALFFGDLM